MATDKPVEAKKKKKSGGILNWILFIWTLPIWLPAWAIAGGFFLIFGIISSIIGFILSIPFRVL